MYTIKINIAEDGSPYIDSEGVTHNTLTGHMWYSISDGTSSSSFGFAPTDTWEGWSFYDIDLFNGTDFSGVPIAPGKIYPTDDGSYTSRYYTGEIVITSGQYTDLLAFGDGTNLHGFTTWYDGLDNSCVDYVWKALNIIGVNPNDFEGQILPTHNADDADSTLYKYLMGSTSGWDESLPDAGGYDVIYGSSGNDVLRSKDTTDAIYGGGGNDVLIGGNQADTLKGGAGFDTYISANGDTIEDSDSKGKVLFDSIDLTGVKTKLTNTELYEDDDFVYEEAGDTLLVIKKQGGDSISIKNWSNKSLGIELSDTNDIEVSITDSASASEGDSGQRSLSFTVSLSRALVDGESLDVGVSDTVEGSYTFLSGEQSHTFTHTWNGDTTDDGAIDHIATLTPTATYAGPTDDVEVTILNSGTATVYDDDEGKRHDPLALDMDMDGFISTTSLEESTTYFDITGDGLRERVGWIKSNDALLTYDKNENGQIDGIDEVFGNLSESGFEELKRLIDSNHDNTIDRRDELYSRLQVWNDTNQDAKVQEGDKELLADIQLATDAKDTKVYIEDIPDFTIDPSTNLLPQLQGSGLVYDSFIRYNIDPEFKALAQEMSTNTSRIATEFDSFIEQYSGYTAFINEMQERYSVDGFEMQTSDKQAWIVERFEATDKYTSSIENYYHTNLNNSKIPTRAHTNNETINIKYQSLTDTLESSFAMDSVFKDVTPDNAAEYFNDASKSIDEKLYLAKTMYRQQNELDFSVDTIVNNIDNKITKELVRYIYTGEEVTLFESKENYSSDGIIVTSNEDDIITTSNENNKILLGEGEDKLISGKGNNTFYFRRGDGIDTIYDRGGLDRLVFDEGITRDDVTLELNRNRDLVISLNDTDDKVTLVDWMTSTNRVEVIEFGDGTTLKFQDVFELFEATDDVEVIQLSSGNDTLLFAKDITSNEKMNIVYKPVTLAVTHFGHTLNNKSKFMGMVA